MNSMFPVSTAPVSSLFLREIVYEELIEQTLSLTDDFLATRITFNDIAQSLSFVEDLEAIRFTFNSTIDTLSLSEEYLSTRLTFDTINQTLSITDDFLATRITFNDIEQSLSFVEDLEAIRVLNLEACQQLFFDQYLPTIIEVDIVQSIEFSMFEVDIIAQELILEQVLSTNFTVNCKYPDGSFDGYSTNQTINLVEALGVSTIYNIEIESNLVLSNTIIRF